MASLINRIQRAMLGSAGEEKVRALLAELAIPAGGSGTGTMREVRRGFLRPISDEAILRDALANLGLTGGGAGARPISNIRTAILHNISNAETVMRDELDVLLASDELAGGNGGAPDWVPSDAKIHIDLVGGTPQGRAWAAGAGEVPLDTLLASDNGNGFTYNPAKIVDGVGYKDEDGVGYPAFVGALFTALNANSTFVLSVVLQEEQSIKLELDTSDYSLSVGLQVTQGSGSSIVGLYSLLSMDNPDPITDEMSNSSGLVKVAANFGGNEISPGVLSAACAASMNGRTAFSIVPRAGTWASFDLAGFYTDMTAPTIQSITLYDPLPSTAGLSELSEP